MTTHCWLAQILCPARHCILAGAGEAETQAAAEATIAEPLRRSVDQLISAGTIDPFCGLCAAPRSTWSIETRATRWPTIAEAEPFLRQSEAEQRTTAAIWRGRR